MPVSSCAGFSLNNLSPDGAVALIKVNRPGFERVTANDNNYRRNCLKK